jgi:hypothetical protein
MDVEPVFDDGEGLDQFDDSDPAAKDLWTVIRSYFHERGLVRMALDSYDQFVSSTIMDVIEDTPALNLKPSPQYGPGLHAGEVSSKCWCAQWVFAIHRTALWD